jgi:two-component system LytT family response regulator
MSMEIKAPPRVRAVIVEDEPLARQTIRDFVVGQNWLKIVGEAADGQKAVHLIDKVKPDLVFLDVKIPGFSGLEVLQRINHNPEVVFTTAYGEHATSAFELEALDYVLKPFGQARFLQVLERVKRRLIANGSDRSRFALVRNERSAAYLKRLFLRDGRGRIVQVRVTEITRLMGADDYTEIFAKNSSYLIKLTLKQFEERLDPEHFRRVHRSAIINLDHVISCSEIDRRLMVKLSDGSEVAASRAGSQSLRDLCI